MFGGSQYVTKIDNVRIVINRTSKQFAFSTFKTAKNSWEHDMESRIILCAVQSDHLWRKIIYSYNIRILTS